MSNDSTTTPSGSEPIEPKTLPGVIAEAARRWPDEPHQGPRERRWPLRRGFREGAMWAFGQPTNDQRIEAARRAGQIEMLAALQGYLRLQTQNLDGTEEWKRGVYALSGRLHHMAAEARGQIMSETPVRWLDES